MILSGNVGDKNIEVIFDIDTPLAALLVGDSLRLRQVLINLAGNAVKFTHEGEVVMTARLAGPARRAGVRVYFEVRDTGIGIDDRTSWKRSSRVFRRPKLPPPAASAVPGWAWRSASDWWP